MSRAFIKVQVTRRIGETCVTESQVQNYRGIVTGFENKYGMTYHQFNHYLQHRTTLLESDTLSPEQARSLGQAIVLEEEDTLEWKIARVMLSIWLGLRREVEC